MNEVAVLRDKDLGDFSLPRPRLTFTEPDNLVTFALDRFSDQMEVFRMSQKPVASREITAESASPTPTLEKDAILLVPEDHNSIPEKQFVQRLIESHQIDWLALEMVPAEMQNDLDNFMSGSDASSLAAAVRLAVHLERYWGFYTLRAYSNTPHFDMITACKARGIPVIGLDVLTEGESYGTPQSFGYRNLMWTRKIPASGRGLIFGGSGHFTVLKGLRVQDFLRERFPNRILRMTTFEP